VLVVAHGSTLRAIIKHLDNISDSDIEEVDVPTGIPLVYVLQKKDVQKKNLWVPVKHYYLAPQEEVSQAVEAVKRQGKKTTSTS